MRGARARPFFFCWFSVSSPRAEVAVRISVNDLHAKHLVALSTPSGESLCKVKLIRKSKTGKHGGCKVHIRAKDIFSGKQVEAMMASQDDIDVIKPNTTYGWALVTIDYDDDEPVVELKREECTLRLNPGPLLEELEDAQHLPLECTVVHWRGKHVLTRVVHSKPSKTTKGRRK